MDFLVTFWLGFVLLIILPQTKDPRYRVLGPMSHFQPFNTSLQSQTQTLKQKLKPYLQSSTISLSTIEPTPVTPHRANISQHKARVSNALITLKTHTCC